MPGMTTKSQQFEIVKGKVEGGVSTKQQWKSRKEDKKSAYHRRFSATGNHLVAR